MLTCLILTCQDVVKNDVVGHKVIVLDDLALLVTIMVEMVPSRRMPIVGQSSTSIHTEKYCMQFVS